MIKKLLGIAIVIGAVGAVGAVGLPVSNLLLDAPSAETKAQLNAIPDVTFRKAATVLQNNCAHCHSAGTPAPYYAQLPVASTVIGQDIAMGLSRLDFAGKLKGQGELFNEVDVARIEMVLNQGSMPPLRYTALHWKAMLTDDEKQALRHWIAAYRKSHRMDATVKVGDGLLYALPLTVTLDEKKVALGRQLFHDVRLSGDNTLSCASCHSLTKGGTDQAQFSTGIRGQKGGINSPTVFNATNNFVQFWDGRAKDLVTQAHGPVNNPIEMGSNWKQVLEKLSKDPAYMAAFKQLYPQTGLTGDNIADAIATFEKSLITPNSRFDQYLRGNDKALSKTELAGYKLFNANCAVCHAGVNLGGLSYEKFGRVHPYFTNTANLQAADLGRFNASKLDADRHFFKVPTLRNIAITWPYFHNGSTSDLRQAVKIMADTQVATPLNDQQIDEITAFLKTLTGTYNGKPL